jgi:hypothetical protein
MPKIDVREAEPGPELDAACAEALGIEVVHMAWPCGYMPDGCSLEAAHRVNADFEPSHLGWYSKRRPVKRGADWGWPPKEDEEDRGIARFNFVACVEPILFYSTDISAAWELHNHVDDIGEFLTALISVINYDRDLLPEDFNIGELGMDWVLVDEDVWALATATPHQRARAFLLAHGVKQIEIQE